MALSVEKLEERIDRVGLGKTEIDMQLGGVKFQTMMEVMEFAKLMAVSQQAVPPHLRGNPGACLAICTRALRFGFDPFALAEHSFVRKVNVDVVIENENGGRSTQKQEVEIMCYDSYVIRAVIHAWAPIKGGIIKYAFSGEGDQRRCVASAQLRETGDVISHESPTVGDRIKAIGKSDKGNLKGSPLWITKPDQQLSYDTGRDLCRRYFPEVLMGWYDKDELEEAAAALATDITPKPDIASRLPGPKRKKQGFDSQHVEQQIGGGASGGGEMASGEHATVADKPQETQGKNEPQDEPSGPATGEPETKASEPLARGTRLLAKQKTAIEVRDLADTIGEELDGTERALWMSACEARIKELER